MPPGDRGASVGAPIDSSIDCFALHLGSATDEHLGELRAFGRYWIWGLTVAREAPPLRLYEWTPHGVADLTAEGSAFHRTPAGTPHQIEGLFGYWLISDADHQWVQTPHGDHRSYLLLAGGQSGVHRVHAITWYCPECGNQLGPPRRLEHDGTPESFLDAQKRVVAAFNADEPGRTCQACGSVHPLAYGFRAARTTTWSLPPPKPRRTGAFGDVIARTTEVVEGHGFLVTLDGEPVALLREGEQVYALRNACPHKGGPLAVGEVRRGTVTCPWHRFRFELATGRSATNPTMVAPTYQVILDGDQIRVLR